MWKVEPQKPARELDLEISVCHLPHGTSKWNRIEHRLFSFISRDWRGKSLYSHTTIFNLIGLTATNTGRKVQCDRDTNDCPTGITTSQWETDAPDIRSNDFHGDWNGSLLSTLGHVSVAPRQTLNAITAPGQSGSCGDPLPMAWRLSA